MNLTGRKFGYTGDPVLDRVCELENRVASLEKKDPPNKIRCLRCFGTPGQVREFDPGGSEWVTCPNCGGTGFPPAGYRP